MYAIRCFYHTNLHIPWEQSGIIWTPRFETVEEALLYAQTAVQKWGYDANDIRVVRV